MAFSQNGLLAEGSEVYHVSSPGLHPRTRQTLPAKGVSRAAKLQRQASQAEVEEIWDQKSRRGEISVHMTGTNSVIVRHYHCAGQLPKVCCSSSLVSGWKWNIKGIIIRISFLWNPRGIQNTDGEHGQCHAWKTALTWASADTTYPRFMAIVALFKCFK